MYLAVISTYPPVIYKMLKYSEIYILDITVEHIRWLSFI